MNGPFSRRLNAPGCIWLLAIMLPAIFALSIVETSAQTTTIYIVRHAEKAGNGNAPLLDPQGFERAKALAHVLQDADLTAIFTSTLLRTQQTAKPTAEATCRAKCIVPKSENWETVVDEILANQIGGRVLVVGHSNTVDKIIEGLLAGQPELPQNWPQINSIGFLLFIVSGPKPLLKPLDTDARALNPFKQVGDFLGI